MIKTNPTLVNNNWLAVRSHGPTRGDSESSDDDTRENTGTGREARHTRPHAVHPTTVCTPTDAPHPPPNAPQLAGHMPSARARRPAGSALARVHRQLRPRLTHARPLRPLSGWLALHLPACRESGVAGVGRSRRSRSPTEAARPPLVREGVVSVRASCPHIGWETARTNLGRAVLLS